MSAVLSAAAPSAAGEAADGAAAESNAPAAAGTAASSALSAPPATLGTAGGPAAAYHWQEKPQTTWALAALPTALLALRFSLPGCHARIVSATASGDATATLRRGIKGTFFDLRVTAAWEGSLIDDEGAVTGTGDGALLIEDLDQDTAGGLGGAGSEYRIRWTVDDDAGRPDARLRALLEAGGAAAVRKAVAGFVEELRRRG